ncbi:MAG: hypothetical protein KUG77_14670 [Nannocystaceae bacterium]|nr:hypothetical protein [Nannocystaceae bacterium]
MREHLHIPRPLWALTLACGLTACPSGDDTDVAADETSAGSGGEASDTDDAASSIHAPCDRATYAGGFVVQLEDGFTQVEGQVLASPNPAPKVELDAVDSCRLLEAELYFCDPACASSEVCTAEATCAVKPEAISVGDVTIDGLTADVAMEPNFINFYLNTDDLPHPAFEPGAPISLSAAGGDGNAFELSGMGSDPFEVVGGDVNISMDQPVVLSWTPPSGDVVTTLHIEVDIGHHGGSPATIECDVEDTGSFEIPASLVNGLFEFGVAGFPEINITRRTVDSAMVGDRCVEFVVAPSSTALAVVIDGVTSCNTNEECPDGSSCQGDLTCG